MEKEEIDRLKKMFDEGMSTEAIITKLEEEHSGELRKMIDSLFPKKDDKGTPVKDLEATETD